MWEWWADHSKDKGGNKEPLITQVHLQGQPALMSHDDLLQHAAMELLVFCRTSGEVCGLGFMGDLRQVQGAVGFLLQVSLMWARLTAFLLAVEHPNLIP